MVPSERSRRPVFSISKICLFLTLSAFAASSLAARERILPNQSQKKLDFLLRSFNFANKVGFGDKIKRRRTLREAPFDFDINKLVTRTLEEYRATETSKAAPKKAWTVLVFIAADNDLKKFAFHNLQQMKRVGSSANMNIIVELHTSHSRHQKTLHRMIVQKDDVILAKSLSTPEDRIDSGAPETLIDFCKWSIENYPAENVGVILWNHGIGVIDPVLRRGINPSDLFSFNVSTNLLELDRSVDFLDFIDFKILQEKDRGVCFDDSTGNYLTNDNLDQALKEIVKANNNKKLAFIGFDACLMSMVEIMSYVKRHADIMVSSQEVELGPGWHYSSILAPIKDLRISKQDFAKHIVETYRQTYEHIFQDFTLSAIDLSKVWALEENIDKLSALLLNALRTQKENSVTKAISISKHRNLCTNFDEPSYIDIDHFYENLSTNLGRCSFADTASGRDLCKNLKETIATGREIIAQAVIANQVGKKLSRARGISIYFPEKRIHCSYKRSEFALRYSWLSFLNTHLSLRTP